MRFEYSGLSITLDKWFWVFLILLFNLIEDVPTVQSLANFCVTGF